MSSDGVIRRLGSVAILFAVLSAFLIMLGHPMLVMAQGVAAESAPSCNCDLKGLMEELRAAQASRERLRRENTQLAEKVTRVQQQLLKDAAKASEGVDPYTNTAAVVAWNAFSLLMDASLDWADARLDLGKAELKESLGIDWADVAGPSGRAAKLLAKKATVKGSKVGKGAGGTDDKTLKMLAALSNPLVETAAKAMQKMTDNLAKITATRNAERLAWARLLGADCRAALKEYCPMGDVGGLGKRDLDAAIGKVNYPPELVSPHSDRALEEQYYPRGFLKGDINDVREMLTRTGDLSKQVYQHRMAAGDIEAEAMKAAASCSVCAMLETLRALSEMGDRVEALEADWRHSYLKLLRSVTGSHKDIVRLWKEETKGRSREITSHSAYKFAGLAFSLFTRTTVAGTAFSMADAVSEISQALGDLYYKAPVADEIKRNARLTQVFADGMKQPIEELSTLARTIEAGKVRLIAKIVQCGDFKECPPPGVVEIVASRGGEILYKWHSGDPRPRISRAIDRGGLDLRITFDTDMDQDIPAVVAVDGYGTVEGKWRGPRVWAGQLEIPEGEALGKLAGWRTVTIEATARSGIPLKAATPKPGVPQLLRDARLHFEAGRPQLAWVRVMGGGRVYYDSGKVDEPLPPGSYTILLRFDRPMLELMPADVILEPVTPPEKAGERSLHDDSAVLKSPARPPGIRPLGNWDGKDTWEGGFELPPGDAFERLQGVWTLAVQALSQAGRKLDGEPAVDGEQPNRSHTLRVAAAKPVDPMIAGCWSYTPFGRIEISSSLRNGFIVADVPVNTWLKGVRRLEFVGNYAATTRRLSLKHDYTPETLGYFLYEQDPDYKRLLATGAKYVLNVTLVDKPFVFSNTWPHLAGELSTGLGGNPGRLNLIRYSPEYYSLTITGSDYRTPRQAIKSGEPFWIVARSGASCPLVKDKIPLYLDTDPAVIPPLEVMLEETGVGTGEFRSSADGIRVHESFSRPSAVLRIQPGTLPLSASVAVSATVEIPFISNGPHVPGLQAPAQPASPAPPPSAIPRPPRFEPPQPPEPGPLLEPELPREFEAPR